MKSEILVRTKQLSLSCRMVFPSSSRSPLLSFLFLFLFFLGDAARAQESSLAPGNYFIHSTTQKDYQPCIQPMVIRSFNLCPSVFKDREATLQEIIEDSINVDCKYHNFERAMNSLMTMDPPFCNSNHFLVVFARTSFISDDYISLEIHRAFYPFDTLLKAEMYEAGYLESTPFDYIATEYPNQYAKEPPSFWKEILNKATPDPGSDWWKIAASDLPITTDLAYSEISPWVYNFKTGQTLDPVALFSEEIREIVYQHLLKLEISKDPGFNIHHYEPALKRHWDWGFSPEGMYIYYGAEGEFRHPYKTLIPKENIPAWPF